MHTNKLIKPTNVDSLGKKCVFVGLSTIKVTCEGMPIFIKKVFLGFCKSLGFIGMYSDLSNNLAANLNFFWENFHPHDPYPPTIGIFLVLSVGKFGKFLTFSIF